MICNVPIGKSRLDLNLAIELAIHVVLLFRSTDAQSSLTDLADFAQLLQSVAVHHHA